jgi:hypothetical protein
MYDLHAIMYDTYVAQSNWLQANAVTASCSVLA